jgi:long-subunit fatty acid transport protein
MKLTYRIIAVLAALVVSSGLQAGELPTDESMAGLQFNFSAPGARSLGMGGAFLGRADDATAAYANPAGLTNLFSSEVSAEFRQVDYSTEYTSGGTFPNVTRSNASSDTNNLSYLSYVVPKEKWVFAFYRHQFMDFNSRFDTAVIDGFAGGSQAFPTTNKINVNIVNYGFSTAFRASDRLSFGLNVSYFDYGLGAFTERKDLNNDLTQNQQFQQGNDDDYGLTLGALFRASDRLSIGLVYRTSTEFDTTNTFSRIAGDPELFTVPYGFEVPDMFGVGFSFQPNDNLTINLDINKVNYSALASPAFWSLSQPPTDEIRATVGRLQIDDGTEIHLGAEYVMKNKPIALRFGAWHDPDHTLTFQGTPADDFIDQFFASRYPGGSDETHISFGFGYFWENFQLDVAADFSGIQDTISFSGVYRFN